MKKAVMVYDMNTSFMRRDMDIFRESGFNVMPCEIRPTSFWAFARTMWKQLVMLLRHHDADTIWVVQSAGYISVMPALMSRITPMGCMVIVIGTDGANLPEIDYGHHRKFWLNRSVGISLRNCSGIATVHHSLESADYSYFDVKHRKQGFRAFVNGVKTEVREIVNGFSHEKWGADVHTHDRKPDFLTVFVATWAKAAIRKGFDLILEAAERMPSKNFLIVGEAPEGAVLPPNLKVRGNVDQIALRKIYNEHQFYLQLSAFEGFPNTLCEAMACGCFPIGSNVAGIPDIIEDWGEVITRKDVTVLMAAIERAEQRVAADPHYAQKVSDGLFSRFSWERRRRELVGFAHDIMKR